MEKNKKILLKIFNDCSDQKKLRVVLFILFYKFREQKGILQVFIAPKIQRWFNCIIRVVLLSLSKLNTVKHFLLKKIRV